MACVYLCNNPAQSAHVLQHLKYNNNIIIIITDRNSFPNEVYILKGRQAVCKINKENRGGIAGGWELGRDSMGRNARYR